MTAGRMVSFFVDKRYLPLYEISLDKSHSMDFDNNSSVFQIAHGADFLLKKGVKKVLPGLVLYNIWTNKIGLAVMLCLWRAWMELELLAVRQFLQIAKGKPIEETL
jgi:hypothetical protein